MEALTIEGIHIGIVHDPSYSTPGDFNHPEAIGQIVATLTFVDRSGSRRTTLAALMSTYSAHSVESMSLLDDPNAADLIIGPGYEIDGDNVVPSETTPNGVWVPVKLETSGQRRTA